MKIQDIKAACDSAAKLVSPKCSQFTEALKLAIEALEEIQPYLNNHSERCECLYCRTQRTFAAIEQRWTKECAVCKTQENILIFDPENGGLPVCAECGLRRLPRLA